MRGIFIFHTFDEADFAGWQSGLYFADGTPKPSLPAFKRAVADLRNGKLTGVAARLLAVAGQYVAYTFFKVDPAWRRLPIEERSAGKDAFAEAVEDWAGRMASLRAYSVAGVRPDADFFLWKITERYEDLGELGAALNGDSPRRLALDALLLPGDHEGLRVHEGAQAAAGDAEGLALPRRLPLREAALLVLASPGGPPARDERAHAGRARVRDDRQPHDVSFGIDDQEFMTAFECEEPSDFMHLMLTLRDSEASRYTERDTPIFVGRALEIREGAGRTRRGRRSRAEA